MQFLQLFEEIKLCISTLCKAFLNSCSVLSALIFLSNLDQITGPM